MSYPYGNMPTFSATVSGRPCTVLVRAASKPIPPRLGRSRDECEPADPGEAVIEIIEPDIRAMATDQDMARLEREAVRFIFGGE